MIQHHTDFDECCGYVTTQLKERPIQIAKKKYPATLTISRQTGTRGRNIANMIRDALNSRCPKKETQWAVFDEDLPKKILKDHDLPVDMAKFMPDDAVGEIESSINEILGRHPSQWTLFEHTIETVVDLSRKGHAIIVGRAGNKITKGMSNVLNVRFIGNIDSRARRISSRRDITHKDAVNFIHKEDAARKNYMKQHFEADIEDANSYDLVINTDCLSDESIVEILIAAIKEKS
jgi:cytidylate kinase